MIGSNKPIFTEDYIWASNPPGGNDVAEPDDNKKTQGFKYAEIPLHNMFNWYGNQTSTFCVHSNTFGIPEWDDQTTYTKGSLVLHLDTGGTNRVLWIAEDTNTGDDPNSGSGKWREFYNTLADFQDVDITSPQNDDVLQQIIYDDEDESVPFHRMWENRPGTGILYLKDMNDVIGSPIDGSILFYTETTNLDEVFTVINPNYLMNYLSLDDFYDVSVAGLSNKGDVLTWNGSSWEGHTDTGFVEWDDILYRVDYFNPVPTDVNTIGGFRARLEGDNDLFLLSSPAIVPKPITDLTATMNLADKVTISWTVPSSGEDHDYVNIYRDGEYIGRSADNVVTYYDDTTGDLNKVYQYNAKRVNSNGESLPSNDAFGARTDVLPAPQNLVASQNISSTLVMFTWDSMTGATGYNLYSSSDGTNYSYAAGGIHSPYYLNELPDTTKSYYITAINPDGLESAPSDVSVGKTAAQAGNKIFETNGTFTIPNGITKVLIQATGGGGSGAVAEADDWDSGGGYAAELINKTVDVTGEDIIQITVGDGGQPVNYTSLQDGGKGDDTILIFPTLETTMVATGGLGGVSKGKLYQGNGKGKLSPVTGLYYFDGLHSNQPNMISCYGGECSAFGNGGSRSGALPGPGAGGSAISKYQETYDNPAFCDGGNGIVVISWDDPVLVDQDEPDAEQSAIIGHSTDLNRSIALKTDLKIMFPNVDMKDFFEGYKVKGK